MARVPDPLALQAIGRVIKRTHSLLRPYGLPLIGPMPGQERLFEACVFTFGITQGCGAW